jgi:TonB family protein
MEDAIKAATDKPTPEYSPVAQQMKVTGKVEVEAVIDTGGGVETVKVLSGNPLLTPSVVQTVKRWKFNPFTSGGQPARAVTILSFDFRR